MKRKRVVIDCSDAGKKGVSLTKQSFADASDINRIVKKFMKTGILGDPTDVGSRKSMFGDFSSIDYSYAMNQIAVAQSGFDLLSSELRAKFSNDLNSLLSFVDNPDNKQEAQELGLLEKDVSTPINDVVEPPSKDSDPPVEPPATPEVSPVPDPENV